MLRRVNRTGALAVVALVAALTSSSYAARVLPLSPGSVGSTQLKRGAVTGVNLAPGAISARAIRRGTLRRRDLGTAVAGAVGAPPGSQAPPDRAARAAWSVLPVRPASRGQRARRDQGARRETAAFRPSRATFCGSPSSLR